MGTVLHGLVNSDGWAFATGLFAMLGTFAAAYAIGQAGRARAAAADLLREERRREFRIDAALYLLDEPPGDWSYPGVQQRLRLFAPDDLPVSRWFARIDSEWPEQCGPEPVLRVIGLDASERANYHQLDEQGRSVAAFALVGEELRLLVSRLVDEQIDS